jgi:hypothetical protein
MMKKIKRKIANVIFNEVIFEMNSNGYEIDNWCEQQKYLIIEAHKSTDEHNFDVNVRYDHLSHLMTADVFCLSPITETNLIFCLKVLNYCSVSEDNAHYHLCPKRHVMACKTYDSVNTCRTSIGEIFSNQVDCSIDNLEMIYTAIEEDCLRYLIGNIHPIQFHNYFFN